MFLVSTRTTVELISHKLLMIFVDWVILYLDRGNMCFRSGVIKYHIRHRIRIFPYSFAYFFPTDVEYDIEIVEQTCDILR